MTGIRIAVIGAVSALTLGSLPPPAHAQWFVESGVEAFRWREHTAPIEVKESGPRFAFGAGYALPRQSGALFTAFARVYGGAVNYDGALLSSPSTPAQGTTKYVGGTEGVGFRYRWPQVIDAVGGLEFDQWRRELTADQHENYRFASLRFGVERIAAAHSPWIAGGGLRFLVGSNEVADVPVSGVTNEVTLTPGLGTNAYLHLGLAISPHVTLLGYWDGMRIAESNTVPISRNEIVFQPQSDMDVYGIRLLYMLGGAPGE